MKWGSGRWWVKAPCLKWEPKATSVVPYFLAFSCPLSVFSSAMCVDQTYMKITLHQAIILKIQQLWDSLSAKCSRKKDRSSTPSIQMQASRWIGGTAFFTM